LRSWAVNDNYSSPLRQICEKTVCC
jgi:hypothetical protein